MNLATQRNETGQMATLGGRIRVVREARGLKLGETAKNIGISRTSLGQWEAGAVKNPDVDKVMAFTKLTNVSLSWLLDREGPDPDLSAANGSSAVSSHGVSLAAVAVDHGNNRVMSSAKDRDGIREIAAPLTSHGNGLDLTTRAVWAIPDEVLELAFHSTPGSTVMMRVIARAGSEFGLQRDDYVLIDTTRNAIDEAGVYLLADPDGKSARRAVAVEENGKLKVVCIADDLARVDMPSDLSSGDARVLGRVMGVFRPL